ncbi:Sensor histidine kinase/response regulator [Pseudomonas cannabina pv. alisalensis]|uniref:histidine kinase n=2 Tax=Pseudomonas cannabina TaxID=86840 RepID=A0A3M3Q4W4_PSECA|nr:hybrid sensor histidine kinase/response regulator [Pseudomonas cannabina]KPW26075.1 Sensor histidine kinase/response regulator [Pseudomonas cannabina pv. alisalensis]MBM0141933.1 hybrid sensor histidine kinase/response regulator [Pseudomonas cannabina pv. alisalensis]RMN79192.1 Sensor histidine kinase/response regulator [Pseudomonas cannabina]RMN88363.1 Sensor histidine kinase/response regulator [Pseudomonas cannabina pv. alisalensis]RMO02669.1 Sensor histidine kinase/response regulator [Ps
MKDWKQAERNQATIRLILAGCVIAYMVVVGFLPDLVIENYQLIIGYYTGVLVFSLILRQHIVSYPGIYVTRRLLAMVHDYVGISVGLVLGGEATLPLFSLMVWVTLGYGMRFGSRYLATAAVMALLSILITYQLTPYWQAQPYMVVMLTLIIILVPAYANTILIRLRQVSEQATIASQEKDRFLAQASHDLRQPIHSIGMFTACLRTSPLGDYERQLVDNIDRSLQNVSQLFRSILDIYTLDSGKVSVKSDVVNIGDLLRDIARKNAAAARWAGVEIRVRPCQRWIKIDATLLSTMIQNIISNALKYAPEHPILIGVRRTRSGLSIHVHDQGRGISAEHLPKVFDEFYRVRHTRDKDIERVGLGLSIVRRLSQILDVHVSLVSRMNHGTTVAIHGLQEVPPPARQPVKKILGDNLLRGLKVCLVEDDDNVLTATATLLERWGCEVQTARSAQGLTSECDILIADYDLRNAANGVDCIDQIRAARGRDIPAMIITGRDVGFVAEQLHRRNVLLLAKPLRPSELRLSLLSMRVKATDDSE